MIKASNLVKIKSNPPISSPAITETTITKTLRRTTCSLVGQTTFLSSASASLTKRIGLDCNMIASIMPQVYVILKVHDYQSGHSGSRFRYPLPAANQSYSQGNAADRR